MLEHKLKRAMLYSIALFLLAGLFRAARQMDVYQQRKAKTAFAGEEYTTVLPSSSENISLGGNFTAKKATVWELFFGPGDAEVLAQLGENYIVLSKEAAGDRILIQEQPLTASIQVELPESTDYLTADSIYRICGGNYYRVQPDTIEPKVLAERQAPVKQAEQEGQDILEAVMQTAGQDEQGIVLTLVLDTVYESFLYEDEWNYYISLKRPAELYDKIVVLDAGHGGKDPGTSSVDAAYQEKTINLDVVLYAKELLENRENMKTYYTRTTDQKPSLEQRAAFANAVQADLFISVHCNYNESKNVTGTEVLYSSAQNGRIPLDSKRLAQICLDKMVEGLGLYNRGIIDRKGDLYIIDHSEVPVALIELGYISNQGDLAVLVSEEAGRTAAESICKAIDAAFEEIDIRKGDTF